MMSDNGDQTFIIVKYGVMILNIQFAHDIRRNPYRSWGQKVKVILVIDNEQALFNPWCSSHTLMEWIRKKCRCDEDIIIDLVDLEGQVKNLSARSKEYASEVVNGRETYVLIRVEKVAENKYHYTSLLNDLENTNPDLLGKLSTLSKPQPKIKGKKGKQMPKPPKSSRLESPSKRPGSSGDKKKK